MAAARAARPDHDENCRRRLAASSNMTTLERSHAMDALAAVYRKVTVAVEALDEIEMMRRTRCAGWAVADVLYHQLLDARRALRTFATPSAGPVDVDDISYWQAFSPRSGQPFA